MNLALEFIGDRAFVARLGRVRAAVRDEVSRAVFRLALEGQRRVKQTKLSGQVLHTRTGHLRASIIARSESGGPSIFIGAFGVPRGPTAIYGYVHEFGGTMSVRAHLRMVRQVFGREVEPFEQQVRAHTRTVPERSFLRTTLRELAPLVREQLAAAVRTAVAR